MASLERLYKDLKGSRAAIYPTGDPKRLGGLGLVGILDIGDPEAHLAEMEKMVKHLNRAVERLAKEAGVKPHVFRYEGKAEKMDGADVHVISVAGPLGEVPESALGPDFGKVRLVVVGKQVVFLVGSHLDLLKQTVSNLKNGNKGLAGERLVTGELSRLAKGRKLGVHVNLENIARTSVRTWKGRPVKGLTSVALTVEPDRLQLEIVAAKSEIKPFAGLLGLADED